ncbi:MAG: sulfatase-like hydrolase/transferase [Bacteroidota bacterium]
MKQIFPLALALLLAIRLPAQKPNILWIITDDQRADALACYNRAVSGKRRSPLGYVSSPKIDQFAKEGVLFTNAYCNSPGCAPSRASMITGKYPHHSGIYGFEYSHNGPDFVDPTTPEVMISKGYNTARFGKLGVRIFRWQGEGGGRGATGFYQNLVDMKGLQRAGKTDFYGNSPWQNGGVIGTSEEWHYPDGSMKSFWINRVDGNYTRLDTLTRETLERDHDVLRSYTRSNKNLILGGVSPQPGSMTLDANITEAFKNYLNNPDKKYTALDGNEVNGPNSSKPQFIHLGYHFPHTPVLPPQSFRDQFKNKVYKIPDFSTEEVAKLPKQLQNIYNGMKVNEFTYKEKQQMIRDYYAFCAFGDSLIGESIAAFKNYCNKQGQDYLILLACGDHGWHLGEQGISAKFAPYKQSNHTAVIVASSDPSKFPANTVINKYIEFVDFAPTFIAAAGENVNKPAYDYLDGYDLAEVVNGNKPAREYVIGEMNQVVGDRAYIRGKDFAFSMRARKGWGKPSAGNILTSVRWPLNTSRKNAELALFDLRVDPHEQNNVAYEQEYIKLANWFRTKLGNIVLGDGRVESAWEKENIWGVSNFARGADDKKLGIPAAIIPDLEKVHVPLESVAVEASEVVLPKQSQLFVIPEFFPFNASNKNLNWETSDASIISINNGVVRGEKTGTATITLVAEEDQAIKASFEVKVVVNKEPEPVATPLNVTDGPEKTGAINIYPNPATGTIHLEHQRESLSYRITDLNGKVLKTGKELKTKTIDVSELKSGVYLLNFFDDETQEVHRVLKQ